MLTFIAVMIAYFLGSLSSAIIISKIFKTPDPRKHGSGNAGATNVLRTAGKQEALLVLIGDILKGFLAVLIGHLLDVTGPMLGLVALAAVAGHIFPVFFGFKGGKGVATTMGVLLGLSVISAVLMAVAWLAVAFTTRYASLASLIAVILAPVFLIIFSLPAYVIPFLLIAALIIWKHKENIMRLINHSENKITF